MRFFRSFVWLATYIFDKKIVRIKDPYGQTLFLGTLIFLNLRNLSNPTHMSTQVKIIIFDKVLGIENVILLLIHM